jgi:hypothetical protein
MSVVCHNSKYVRLRIYGSLKEHERPYDNIEVILSRRSRSTSREVKGKE